MGLVFGNTGEITQRNAKVVVDVWQDPVVV